MRRFLFRLAFCFIILVVICMIPCHVFEKKTKENSDSIINYVGNLDHFDADLIILGNSRAACGYNTSILNALTGKKCLNLGVHGQSFDFHYHVMYKRYLIHNNKPQYILVDVGPFVFFKRIKNNAYSLEMLPYVGRDDFEGYFNMCPGYKIADRIMFFRYFGKLDNVIKQLGELEKKVDKTSRKEIMENGKKDSLRMHSLECDTTIIRMFCDFLDECAEENVRVIMVCSPMHSDRGKIQYDMDSFWRIIKYCMSGRKIVAISYQDLFDSDTSYFADPMHLNSYGRDCFTKKLAHDLDSFNLLK